MNFQVLYDRVVVKKTVDTKVSASGIIIAADSKERTITSEVEECVPKQSASIAQICRVCTSRTRSGQELVFPVRISPSRTDLRMRAKKIIA